MIEGILSTFLLTVALSQTTRHCVQEWRIWQCEAALFEAAHSRLQGRLEAAFMRQRVPVTVFSDPNGSFVSATADCPGIGTKTLTLKELRP